MQPLKIFCHLPAATALKVGLDTAGDFEVTMHAGLIDDMRKRSLLDVGAEFCGLEVGSVPRRLETAGDTWQHVLKALIAITEQTVVARRAATQAKRAAASLVLAYGQPSQCERFNRDALPPDELLALARKVAFLTFDGLAKLTPMRRLSSRSISHTRDCPYRHGQIETPTRYDSADGGTIDSLQLDVLRKAEQAAERSYGAWGELSGWFTTPRLQLRTHTAVCLGCEQTISHPLVKVSITWAGQHDRPLTREFDLRTDLVHPPT